MLIGKVDLEGVGLGMFLLPYQQDALVYLYDVGEANSRQVWMHVNRPGAPDPKSRAAVINYMQGLAEEGLIGFREQSGKGGYHKVYCPSLEYLSLEGLERELVRRLLLKVATEFNVVIGYRWLGESTMNYVRGEES